MVGAVDLLAVNNFGDTRTGSLAGPMGALVILLMAIATVLLIRNMNARLRRLPDRFPAQDEGSDQPDHEAGSAESGAPGAVEQRAPKPPTGPAA